MIYRQTDRNSDIFIGLFVEDLQSKNCAKEKIIERQKQIVGDAAFTVIHGCNLNFGLVDFL